MGNPAMIVLWLVKSNSHGVANPGSVSDGPQQRSTRLHTGPNKATNADRGQAPGAYQQLSTKAGSSVFEVLYLGQASSIYLGCGLQPSSELEGGVWFLVACGTQLFHFDTIPSFTFFSY